MLMKYDDLLSSLFSDETISVPGLLSSDENVVIGTRQELFDIIDRMCQIANHKGRPGIVAKCFLKSGHA
jgi:hypothetical protein